MQSIAHFGIKLTYYIISVSNKKDNKMKRVYTFFAALALMASLSLFAIAGGYNIEDDDCYSFMNDPCGNSEYSVVETEPEPYGGHNHMAVAHDYNWIFRSHSTHTQTVRYQSVATVGCGCKNIVVPNCRVVSVK